MAKPKGQLVGRKTRDEFRAAADKKAAFIKVLAVFLVGEQARKSIMLEMGNTWAREWATLRSATPIEGYPTIEEGERILREFLA